MSKNNKVQDKEQLLKENEELRMRLADSMATLNAIRNMHEDTLIAKGTSPGNFLATALSESSARIFFDNLNESVLTLTQQGKIKYCNNRFAMLMNTPVEQIIGSNIRYFILPEWQNKFENLLNNIARADNSENITFQPEGSRQHIHLHLSLSPLSETDNTNEIGLIAIDVSLYKVFEDELREARSTLEKRVAERTANLAQANKELVKARIATLSMMGDTVEVMNELEITNSKLLAEIGERKKSEVKLEQANKQLHALTSRIVTVREEERTALSREIHDELGSALTGVKMGLMHIKRTLPGDERSKDFANMHEILASMTNIIDGTIRMVRKIITDLRPEILDEVGLAEALQWYGSEFNKRTSISVGFTIYPKRLDIDKKQTTELFRIFQEILANVAKHSAASKVVVFLKKENDQITLRVKDDGIGIKDIDMVKKNSFGIMGIRERAILMAGHMNIKGAPGKGTTITIEVPAMKTDE